MTLRPKSRLTSNRKSGRTRSPAPTPNREYYNGANQTRNSIAKNPGAYTSPKDPNFGVPTFGQTRRMPSEEVLDAAAEQTINQGYSLRRNKLCGSCFVQMPNTGVCGSCD
jgi:hypothetical protein